MWANCPMEREKNGERDGTAEPATAVVLHSAQRKKGTHGYQNFALDSVFDNDKILNHNGHFHEAALCHEILLAFTLHEKRNNQPVEKSSFQRYSRWIDNPMLVQSFREWTRVSRITAPRGKRKNSWVLWSKKILTEWSEQFQNSCIFRQCR